MKIKLYKDSAPIPRNKKKETVRLTVRLDDSQAQDYRKLGRIERRKVPSLCRVAINTIIKKLKTPAV